MNTRPDLKALAAQHGQSNLRFFLPTQPLRLFPVLGIAWTSSEDETAEKEFVVDDGGRYPKFSDNYKISLRCLDPKFADRDFYICDLESLMQEEPEAFRVSFLGTDVH